MKLKTIKSKLGNLEYTKFLKKEISLIKKQCKISKSKTVYFLCHYKQKEIFLCNGQIYIAGISYEFDKNGRKIISSMNFEELYKITLFKDYPKTLNDINLEVIVLNNSKYAYTVDEFLDWIDEPSEINEAIDLPYYEIIKFLNSYKKESFRTKRYLFYSKWDDDSNFITNIYAFDIKNKAEVKIYIPDKWVQAENDWKLIVPQTLNDITIDDLSGALSCFQKRECKKAFLKWANEYNEVLNVKNYWVIELIKQTVQPVDILHEWGLHRIFCKPEKFSNNIWVYDFPKSDEEPYFMIIDKNDSKIALINFKTPTYHRKGIYKQGNVKRKGFELDKKHIKELMDFLKAPSAKTNKCLGYDKYVKTNWQQLIFEYNHNSAGWGWGEAGLDISPEKDPDAYLETLPFNLAIPNYLKLLNDKW